jgi:hypothetical protein
LHLLWDHLRLEFESQFEVSSVDAEVVRESVFREPILRRFSSPWSLPTVAALPGTVHHEDDLASDGKVEFYWVGTDARLAGTLVHRWLHLIANNGCGNIDTTRDALQQLTSTWLHEAGISAAASGGVLERVVEAVCKTLMDPKGQWILEGSGFAELGLSGFDGTELVSVILDRVRIDDDGTHWIIDYKTSSHEGGNLDGFLRAEVERYQPQLNRYAAIYREWSGEDVKAALYFPLLTTFIELVV